eukprot:10407936-Heterocapsa_arctica.AAC.1
MPQPPQAPEHSHCTAFFQLSNQAQKLDSPTTSSDALLGLALCEGCAIRALPGCLRRNAMRGERPARRT